MVSVFLLEVNELSKKINTYPLSLPKADKFIFVFLDNKEIENIECEIPFLYCIYPDYEVVN